MSDKYTGAVQAARTLHNAAFFSSLKAPQIYYQIKRFGWRWDGAKWAKPKLYQLTVEYLCGGEHVDWIPHSAQPDNDARALIIRGHQLYAVNRVYKLGGGKFRVITHRNEMVLYGSETAFIQMPDDGGDK
jgi:hypothetical protein